MNIYSILVIFFINFLKNYFKQIKDNYYNKIQKYTNELIHFCLFLYIRVEVIAEKIVIKYFNVLFRILYPYSQQPLGTYLISLLITAISLHQLKRFVQQTKSNARVVIASHPTIGVTVSQIVGTARTNVIVVSCTLCYYLKPISYWSSGNLLGCPSNSIPDCCHTSYSMHFCFQNTGNAYLTSSRALTVSVCHCACSVTTELRVKTEDVGTALIY